MSVREEFFNTFDPSKILELYKQLTPAERDKQAITHFNNVIKKIGQKNKKDLLGTNDPDIVYELRKAKR